MYVTVDDMTSRFSRNGELVQLTDMAGTGAVDPDAVTQALADASTEVDSYLKTVYDLTQLSPVPPMLVRTTCDIARYNLYTDAAPDQVQTRYDAAIAWLKNVQTGVVKLDIVGNEPPSTPDTIDFVEGRRGFSRDRLRGF